MLNQSKPSLAVVIPAYNEAQRIPATLSALIQYESEFFKVCEIWVVDDGSSDGTADVVESFVRQDGRIKTLTGEPNRGKGYAVRRGLQAGTADWLLVADADMATPWDQMERLFEEADRSQAQIAIGSRDVAGSELVVRQSILRETLGKLFNLAVRLLTGLPFKDTQCGFKLVHRASVQRVLSSLRVNNFAWDVELLSCAKIEGLQIVEVPVRWLHQEDSRVSLFRDGLSMIVTVVIVRWRSRLKREVTRWAGYLRSKS